MYSISYINSSATGGMAGSDGGQRRVFSVKYAGLVPEISSDIDPSGRTDLLKILDAAGAAKQIFPHDSANEFVEDAHLEVDCDALRVTLLKDKEDVQLVVPLHMLASVGFVREEGANIVPLKIGGIDAANEIYDLAVLYTKEAKIAEDICEHLGARFHQIYRDSISALNYLDNKFSVAQSSASNSSKNGSTFVDPIPQQRHTISSSTSGSSSKNTVDLINDYITMLSACLSHEELNKFAVLMRRWRAKEMPILEFAQKLMELYGVDRKHLLARMKNLLRGVSREDIEALNDFLRANGVSDNAAGSLSSSTSPLWTCEMLSATTDNSPADEAPSPGSFDNVSGASA